MINKHLIGLLFFGILLTACDSGMIYDHFISSETGNWKWNDVAVFEVDITDTTSLNNIFLQVRHSTDYPLSNLYMFINVKGPGGQFRRDTVNMILAGPDGKWLGSGSGKLRELHLLYRSQVSFGVSGIYNFSIEQAMRKAELPVTDVGLRIEQYIPE